MFENHDTNQKRYEDIDKELIQMKKQIVTCPKGNMYCSKNGEWYKWYYNDGKKVTYLPKSQKELAEKLVAKRYYHARIKELEKEHEACEAYLKQSNLTAIKSQELLAHPEYSVLLEHSVKQMDHELKKWMNQSYFKYEKYPEKLITKATHGKMVRSKSESMIDYELDRFGIPFHYEEMLILGQTALHPDFTIRHPKTGEFYYWEHCGMMDDMGYVKNLNLKMETYCSHGIYPGEHLILTYETKNHPLAWDTVENIIKKKFLD